LPVSGGIGSSLLAVLCYLGIVLYGGVLSVPGRSRFGASWQLLLLYVGFFPLPAGSLAGLAQVFVLGFAIASLGPDVLCRNLEMLLEVRGLSTGRVRRTLPGWVRVLVHLPIVLAAGVVLARYTGLHLETGVDPQRVTQEFTRGMSALALLLGAYFLMGWVVGRPWVRAGAHVPLMATVTRFHRMNGFGAVAVIPTSTLLLVADVGPATFFAVVALALLFCLLPALNELAWSYDAVVSRILTAHLLLLACAALVFGVPRLFSALGLGSAFAWPVVLALLAVVAMALPRRLSRAIERVLFPRAAAVRTQLAELGGEPLLALRRGEAAAQLLERVASALDCEGGIIVLPADGAEPAFLHAVGNARPGPLGGPAEAAALLAEADHASDVRPVESLPFAVQLRLLACAVVLVCPIRPDGLQATLLLGPRRGWLYDAGTVAALRVFARQAALALQNLGLLRARAHAAQLAALGEAAARIAHEIRNPLAAARSLVQLGAAGGEPDVTATALLELDRIGRLVGELLAFARREETLRIEEVDLADVCRDALAQVHALAEAGAVHVRSELPAARARGDRDRLVQVVANLCRNAVEALHEKQGPGTLQVRIRPAPGQGRVAIEVRDDGPGIAPDEVAQVFEPFRTTKSTGTGLGLAIARRIVEGHGGRLTVESTVGEGTVFRCELPGSVA
jgi:signal transduction histidine kinase